MSWTPQRLDQLGCISRGRSRHRPHDAAHLYTEDDVRTRADAVYVHVFRVYPTVPSPSYADGVAG